MAKEEFPDMPEEVSETDELERLIKIKMDRDHLDRETARQVAEIELNIKKGGAKEKKRYPNGKNYEGRDTD